MQFSDADPQWHAASTGQADGFAMVCPRCSTQVWFRPVGEPCVSEPVTKPVGRAAWRITAWECTACKQPVVLLAEGVHLAAHRPGTTGQAFEAARVRMIEPRASERRAPPPIVPSEWRRDYREAAAIEHQSPRAAATLLRRIMNGMLREKGLTGGLDDMIEAARTALPDFIYAALDGARRHGAWNAHPKYDHIGELVDVKPLELDASFAAVEEMFESWYIGPERRRERDAAIATKSAAIQKNRPSTLG
jgi:hypothetical protein